MYHSKLPKNIIAPKKIIIKNRILAYLKYQWQDDDQEINLWDKLLCPQLIVGQQ